MTILKGIYYYFKDLVDEKSIDYEKIAIIKAMMIKMLGMN